MYGPLSLEQVYESMSSHGIPKGLALTTMSLIGLNNRNQSEWYSPFGPRSESYEVFRWIRSWNARHPDQAWAPGKPDYDFGPAHQKQNMTPEQRDVFDKESGQLATEMIRKILGRGGREPTIKQIKDALSAARAQTKARLAKQWRVAA
mgnify:CR=1 FL=1